jgi:hypothetical protein
MNRWIDVNRWIDINRWTEVKQVNRCETDGQV